VIHDEHDGARSSMAMSTCSATSAAISWARDREAARVDDDEAAIADRGDA